MGPGGEAGPGSQGLVGRSWTNTVDGELHQGNPGLHDSTFSRHPDSASLTEESGPGIERGRSASGAVLQWAADGSERLLLDA